MNCSSAISFAPTSLPIVDLATAKLKSSYETHESMSTYPAWSSPTILSTAGLGYGICVALFLAAR